MFKIVLLIGFFGHLTCFVFGELSSNDGPYPDSHTPATVYGPPTTVYGPPATVYGPPTTSNPVDSVYGAPPATSSIQIEPELEYNEQITDIKIPEHGPSFVYVASKPFNQFGQLRKPTPSTNAFLPKETPPKPFHSTTFNIGEEVGNTQQSAKFHSQPTFYVSGQHLPQFQEIRQYRPTAEKQQQQVPANEYGPPSNPNVSPFPNPQSTSTPPPPIPSPPVHETVDETPLADDDEQDDSSDPTVIAVANANGQYYILGKDNTLQRVVYRTEQTKDDTINNGFTAHLRYSLVEPIRDPIYGYDSMGHLVRIYNKK